MQDTDIDAAELLPDVAEESDDDMPLCELLDKTIEEAEQIQQAPFMDAMVVVPAAAAQENGAGATSTKRKRVTKQAAKAAKKKAEDVKGKARMAELEAAVFSASESEAESTDSESETGELPDVVDIGADHGRTLDWLNLPNGAVLSGVPVAVPRVDNTDQDLEFLGSECLIPASKFAVSGRKKFLGKVVHIMTDIAMLYFEDDSRVWQFDKKDAMKYRTKPPTE